MRMSMIRCTSGLLFVALVSLPASLQAKELLDLYRLAQRQDQTYLTALHQRDAALEVHPQALSNVLPQIGAASTIGRSRVHTFLQIPGAVDPDPFYFNNYNWNLNLSQVLFSWPAFQTIAKSNLLVAQANATFLAAEQSLLYRVSDAFFTVLNAQDTLSADTDAQAAYLRAQDEARAKYENGVVAITDVRNAEASYDSSSATVITDQRNLEAARLVLSQIVGLADEPDASLRAEASHVVQLLGDEPQPKLITLRDEIPLVRPAPDAEKDWASVAIDENPGLMTFRYAAQAAEKDIAIAGSAWLPTVGVAGSVGRSANDYTGGSDSLDETVGLQFSWQIFQGGLILSKTRQARATKDATLSQFEGQRRVINTSARNAFKGVVAGIASVKATQRAVLSARVSLEATQVGLKVGTRTQLDVLNAQQALTVAQRNFYAARYDYLRNSLALKQAAGQLTEEDVSKIDELVVTR